MVKINCSHWFLSEMLSLDMLLQLQLKNVSSVTAYNLSVHKYFWEFPLSKQSYVNFYGKMEIDHKCKKCVWIMKYEMIKVVENIAATTIFLPSSTSLAPFSNPDWINLCIRSFACAVKKNI